jgi:hypothetical protein
MFRKFLGYFGFTSKQKVVNTAPPYKIAFHQNFSDEKPRSKFAEELMKPSSKEIDRYEYNSKFLAESMPPKYYIYKYYKDGTNESGYIYEHEIILFQNNLIDTSTQ